MFHTKMGSIGLLLLEGPSSHLSSEGNEFLQSVYIYGGCLENHTQNDSRVKEYVNCRAIKLAGIATDEPVHERSGFKNIS